MKANGELNEALLSNMKLINLRHKLSPPITPITQEKSSGDEKPTQSIKNSSD